MVTGMINVDEHIRGVAEIAWESLSAYNVAPSPRNFELWYTYCANDRPSLTERLDRMLEASEPLTPGVLDELFQMFFSTKTDVEAVHNGSLELREIAVHMAERIAADRSFIDNYAVALVNHGTAIKNAPPAALRRAMETLGDSTTQLGQQLHALEQLLVTSTERIGQLEKRLAKSEHDATRDSLTGLANRRLFDVSVRNATTQANQDRSEFSLLMLDIDHFKQFNDRHGHPMGDNVLRLVAKVLVDQLKGRDTAARYGGEEFAIILVGTGLQGAITVGEQIRRLLESRPIINRVSGQRLGVVTGSCGVAAYRPGEPVGDLINRADNALYRAKRTGRNKICAEEPA